MLLRSTVEQDQIMGITMEPRFSADRMDRLMGELDISDGELATLTGLSRSMIYYLRTGKRTGVSGENLRRIADSLHTTVDYLLGEDVPPGGAIPMHLPAPIRRLATVAQQLSGYRQEELIRFAETMAEIDRERKTRPVDQQTMAMLLETLERVERERGYGERIDIAGLLAGLLSGSEGDPPVDCSEPTR